MENDELNPYEIYAATKTLKEAVEELMLSGKEMLDATNHRGEVYVDSLNLAVQSLERRLADIRDIETHQSLSQSTLNQIETTKNEITQVFNALKAIRSDLTESQSKKFDIVNQNVFTLTKDIEKNTQASVSEAINSRLDSLDKKYKTSVSQYLTNAQNHMQQLDSQITESLSKIHSATNSLMGKMIAIAVVSGLVTAIFTSVIIKWLFIP